MSGRRMPDPQSEAAEKDARRQGRTARGSGPARHHAGHPKIAATGTTRLYRLRWRIENAFNSLKDFRRIATRYDKLARNYLA
ncbi:MAG TPA: transposase [Sphingomicrobium sp.]|nr:transposase [Sphingomicrobium sp.]